MFSVPCAAALSEEQRAQKLFIGSKQVDLASVDVQQEADWTGSKQRCVTPGFAVAC